MKFIEVIKEYIKQKNSNFKFIQLGCNDGFMADPLHDFIKDNQWEGILVDADAYYLKNAQSCYSEKNRLRYLNAGVVPLNKTNNSLFEKFYSINPEAIRPSPIEVEGQLCWRYADKIFSVHETYRNIDHHKNNILDYLQGIGSFDYEFVLNHINLVTQKTDASGQLSREIFSTDKANHAKFIKMHFVPIFNINQIFDMSGFQSIDLLQTDLETWDVKIMEDILSFDIKPKIIHFEAPGGISEDLKSKFKKAGYSINRTTDTKDELAILI